MVYEKQQQSLSSGLHMCAHDHKHTCTAMYNRTHAQAYMDITKKGGGGGVSLRMFLKHINNTKK